ncbi:MULTISPECIES: hypothetical protein [unclassified Rhodanobacter]|uniref:hypothetical protein n=1 Tax=unclassified Rhodanobacter TaxID=2621553 RepID=UPI00120C7010|nr:hypothetical protein [Rhodanobacter sp. 115]TAM34415.1 MAG: hypothetical protein EPN56_12345 [Rhodanobacter sp.]
MIRYTASVFLLIAGLTPAVAQQKKCEHSNIHAIFTASNGSDIELNARTGTIRLSHSQAVALYDCGNNTETCFTDYHGFAFSFSRECDKIGISRDPKNTKLTPEIVSVLHGNLWVVFDASPNFLFHYVVPKGVVGIYVGSTPSFDFRSLFHDHNVQIGTLNAVEYQITSDSDAVAACRR